MRGLIASDLCDSSCCSDSQLLWIYPLYAISFILNAIWYQDIAGE